MGEKIYTTTMQLICCTCFELWGLQHQYFTSKKKELLVTFYLFTFKTVADVARAREELDGLKRPSRPFNPLTIIQVKNAERNLDDGKSSCWSYRGYHHRRQKRRFVLTVSLITGLGLIGLSAWAKLPSSDPQECQVQPLQNRLRRGTYWTKSYDNISK